MLKRFFTDGKKNPYDSILWEYRLIKIPGKGTVVNVLMPVTFSLTLRIIAADKYLKNRGVPKKAILDICKIGTVPYRQLMWLNDGTNNGLVSFKQTVHRMVGAWTNAGRLKSYFTGLELQVFYDERVYVIINQMFAPNSPQWFNTGCRWAYGIEHSEPGYYYVDLNTGLVILYLRSLNGDRHDAKSQVSACYIHLIKDSLLGLQSITEMLTILTRLFRNGSGNGFNASALRAEGLDISHGGKTSGMLSFLKIFDKNADAVKSGGKTRRSARNRIVDIDHPEVLNFINWKVRELRKIRDLVTGSKMNGKCLRKIYDKVISGKDPKNLIIERLVHLVEPALIQKTIDLSKQHLLFSFDIYDTDFNGLATKTVSGQNANNNISIDDKFMRRAMDDGLYELTYRKNKKIAKTVKARKLLSLISRRRWEVGDPGLYYIDNTNAWNSCLDTKKITSANPCQLYLNVADSSCNLASLNLTKFKKGKNDFNVLKFCHVILIAYLATLISNSIAISPSKSVALGTYNYRPIGIGFMNLGGLLMSMAIPYDSALGQAWGRVLSALMTGTRYRKSIQIRLLKGPFPKYKLNLNSVNRTLNNHYALLKKLKLDNVVNANTSIDFLQVPKTMYDHALKIFKKVTLDVKKFGIRNNVVTCIRPTGTIGLLMDSGGTMSSEPLYSLIRSKKLADGGYMNTTSDYVLTRLKSLLYTDRQILLITGHLEHAGTILTAPYIKQLHLNVFDCAVLPKGGKRYISVDGHLKMMSAIGGFISMGISKTVNVPSDITILQIYLLFVKGWRMGLKALTIFRDGCRLDSPMKGRNQYLFLKGIDIKKINELRKFAYKPVRKKLPQRRRGFTELAVVGGHKVFLRTGLYDDGTLGLIFIDIYKLGSFARTAVNLLAKLSSKRLQYGVPVDLVVNVFLNVNQLPKGVVNHPNIKMAQSMFDFIGRLLSYRYLGREDLVHTPDKNNEIKLLVIQKKILIKLTVDLYTSLQCPSCGNYSMVKNGKCYACRTCGTSTGCS